MIQDFVSEIKELNRPNVHIKDRQKVNKIISEIVNGGFDKLQVVSDFDATITKQHENGKPHYSSYQMFRCCPSLNKEYLERTAALREKYVPIEFNPNISHEERKRHMEDWYRKAADVFRECKVKVSEKEIYETVSKLNPALRDGSKEFFELLNEKKVPVLVFSAGLGNTVEAALKHHQVLLPNVHVISNFFEYDNDGTIKGYKGILINTFNKNEIALRGTPYYDLILERGNIIVMGDTLGDADMADGISNRDHILKIGFLYQEAEGNLPLYMENFDIVLKDDQTMEVPNAIIRLIK